MLAGNIVSLNKNYISQTFFNKPLALWLSTGSWDISRNNMYNSRMCSHERNIPFLFPVGWNVDSIASAGAAILDHELEGGILINKFQSIKSTDLWRLGKIQLPCFPALDCYLQNSFIWEKYKLLQPPLCWDFCEYSECNVNIPNALLLANETHGQMCWIASRQGAFSPCKRRVLFPQPGCLLALHLWAWLCEDTMPRAATTFLWAQRKGQEKFRATNQNHDTIELLN